MSEKRSNPFSFGYVIKLTMRHCTEAVNVSISRTLARIKEFENDREKSEEIFKTLAKLHEIKAQLESINTSENQ